MRSQTPLSCAMAKISTPSLRTSYKKNLQMTGTIVQLSILYFCLLCNLKRVLKDRIYFQTTAKQNNQMILIPKLTTGIFLKKYSNLECRFLNICILQKNREMKNIKNKYRIFKAPHLWCLPARKVLHQLYEMCQSKVYEVHRRSHLLLAFLPLKHLGGKREGVFQITFKVHMKCTHSDFKMKIS